MLNRYMMNKTEKTRCYVQSTNKNTYYKVGKREEKKTVTEKKRATNNNNNLRHSYVHTEEEKKVMNE